MTNRLHLSLLLLPVLALAACGTALAARDAAPASDRVPPTTVAPTPLPQYPPDDCPITQPPDPPFVPPEPHPAVAPYGEFWYGSDILWALLHPDGRWYALPRDKKGYGQKVLWFRKGYDMTTEQKPQVTVSGRRLDGDETFEQSGATNGHHPDVGMFMLTGVTVPTTGCWEITGHYRKSSLSFVVWIAP